MRYRLIQDRQPLQRVPANLHSRYHSHRIQLAYWHTVYCDNIDHFYYTAFSLYKFWIAYRLWFSGGRTYLRRITIVRTLQRNEIQHVISLHLLHLYLHGVHIFFYIVQTSTHVAIPIEWILPRVDRVDTPHFVFFWGEVHESAACQRISWSRTNFGVQNVWSSLVQITPLTYRYRRDGQTDAVTSNVTQLGEA